MFVDADGNQFPSYEDACIYYGADTPADMAAEAAADAEAAFQEYFWNLNRADQGFPVDEDTARWMFAQRPEVSFDDIPF